MQRKILLVTNGFPLGDSERGFLSEEYKQLAQRFDISILARITPLPPAGTVPENVWCMEDRKLTVARTLCQCFRRDTFREIRRIPLNGGVLRYLRRINAVLRFSTRAEIYEKKIAELCEMLHTDMVYTYWCTSMTFAAVRLKTRLPQIKIITRFHGYDLYNERTEELWQPFRPAIAAGCDRLVFACETGKRYFLKQWGRQWERKAMVSYLGSGKFPPVTPPDKEELCLVSCSNMIPLKRIDYIVDALAMLPEEIQVSWHHIGEGGERPALEKLALEKLAGHENIHWEFHGAVLHSALPGLYGRLCPDLFITTSSTEGGVPVTVQEAFSMGIPVIGTAVGGIPELVVDGKTGFLLPADPTLEEVSGAIMRFYSLDAEQRQAIRENEFTMWQEKCNAEKNAEYFVSALETLLKGQ